MAADGTLGLGARHLVRRLFDVSASNEGILVFSVLGSFDRDEWIIPWSDLLFEILKCLERVPEKPFLSDSVVRLTGLFWSYVCRDERPVSREFVAFMRREQKQKVLSLLKSR